MKLAALLMLLALLGCRTVRTSSSRGLITTLTPNSSVILAA